MNRLRAIFKLVFVLAVAPGPLTCTSAAAAEALPEAPSRVVLVGEPAVFSELAGRILDQMDVPGGVEVGRVERAAPADFFRNEGAAARATAWVIVEGTLARVRAADASRQRFVLRELTVSAPLTELDRESLCQMLKLELVTVIEGGEGALARSEAEQALGMTPAPPPAAEPVPVDPSPAPPAASETLDTAELPSPEPVPRAEKPALGWSIAGRYGLRGTEVGASNGPGLVASLWSNRAAGRPGAWLVLQYEIEQELFSDLVRKAATSLQAGASLEVLAWLRVEAGAGVDLVHFNRAGSFEGQPKSWTKMVPVIRTAFRFGAVRIFDIPISATALLDVASRSVRYDEATATLQLVGEPPTLVPFVPVWTTASWTVHPGVAIDLWWR